MRYGVIRIGSQETPIREIELVGGQLRLIAPFTGPRPATEGVIEVIGRDGLRIRRGTDVKHWDAIPAGITWELRYDLKVTD